MSLIYLTNVKGFNNLNINDYLNRFQQMKSQSFTQIPKHELVRMTLSGLEFSLHKKFVNVLLGDMAQFGK